MDQSSQQCYLMHYLLSADVQRQVVVKPKPASAEFIKTWLPGSGAEQHVLSADVTAVKPLGPPAAKRGG